MIIGIDASSLTLPHPTGVQRYTEYIIKHLLLVGKEHTFRLYTPKPLPEPFAQHQVVIKSPKYWTQIRLPIELFLHKPDMFFQPGYMLPPYIPCRSVTTIHDLAWIHFPESYSEAEKKSQKLAAYRVYRHHAEVIVPSKATKNDCAQLLHIEKERLHTIPEALIELPKADKEAFPAISKLEKTQIILAIGRLEERKNTITLINAAEHLRSKTPEVSLVLVGQTGFGAEKIFSAITHARQSGLQVVHLPNCTDAELAAWLSAANVYVYPSLYEGFGLPILQAFAARVPVIASHNSSIPEVGGEAVMYLHHPKDEEELATALYSVLTNNEKATKMANLGEKRLEQFSWALAAQKTLEVLINTQK